MADSQKIPTLEPLIKQIYRSDNDIIAIRQNRPLYTIELRQQVSSICQKLASSPVQNWALAMQDSFNFVAGLLALLYCGKQPMLLNPLHKEMAQYYQALLTDDDAINNIQLPSHDIININQLAKNGSNTFSPNAFKSQSLTLFTSGSTGLPKPIIKTVYQLEKESEILTAYFGSLSNQLFVASVAHDHMYGLTFKIMLALANKAPFICESIQYQEQLSRYNNQQIIYITTPSIIKTLDSNVKVIRCDKVISAGGPLSYQEANLSLQCFGISPNEIYGSSETGVIATRTQSADNMPWQLFPQMKLKYTDQQPILISPLLNKEEPLNDKITLIDQNYFYLNGRVDKIIKISEKRVSVTYIENELNQLPEIAKVSVIPLEQKNRTILAAVVLLSEAGKQKQQQLGHFHLSQYFRQQLKDKLSLVTIPKKWRFVEQFPMNNQGKSTYIELKALFDNPERIMNKRLPNEIKITIDENSADLVLFVPDDLFWFKGHFPSQPLLPGVVQLNWVMHYSKKIFNIHSDIESIEVIKFQIPILLNDTLLLHIVWNSDLRKLQFSYTVANKVASSGKLKLCL